MNVNGIPAPDRYQGRHGRLWGTSGEQALNEQRLAGRRLRGLIGTGEEGGDEQRGETDGESKRPRRSPGLLSSGWR
jgi:hypothetical protein